ncbi:MAG TPA: hypothetical protein VGQ65_23575 [Thermoanaerobaculia bacterium]|jgi:hypothetical protein|nr:hypothetical protein [Thermoanaerobaculia bacterium]
MFSTELAVQITTVDGDVLSFFLPKDSVRELDTNSGLIEVELIDRGPDFGFVLLPQRTFEGPNAAKVPETLLSAA